MFAADAVGYLRLMGDDERGTAGAVKHREAAHPITLNPNYGFPTNCNVQGRGLQRPQYVDSGRPLRAKREAFANGVADG